MTKEKALAKARDDYPPDCVFNSAMSGVSYTALGSPYLDGSCIRDKNYAVLYTNEKWAKIIEYPKDYNKHQNQEFWY